MTDPITQGPEGAPRLAVDVIPDTAGGAFVVEDSDLDSDDLLAWQDDPDSWVNVVCDVQSVSITRGCTRLQGVLTRAEAGQAVVQLIDIQRRFDPMVNADAIHANTPLRLRAWGTDETEEPWSVVLFTGTIRDVPVTYVHDGPPQVTITATDLIGTLAAAGAAGRPDPGVGAGDHLLGRVVRVLEEHGLAGAVTQQTVTTSRTVTVQPEAIPPATQAAIAIRDKAGISVGRTVSEDFSYVGAVMPDFVAQHHRALSAQYLRSPLVQAASLIVDRFSANLEVFEDWSWYGRPDVVAENNDALLQGFRHSPTDKTEAIIYLQRLINLERRNWLTGYITATTPPTTPTTVTTSSSRTVTTGAATVSTDVDAFYASTQPATTLAGSAWDLITAAQEAELGRVWVDVAGRLVVRGRESELSGPLRGTLSDLHGEVTDGADVHCCFDALDARLGTETLTNRAVAARRVPRPADASTPPASAVVQLDDEVSRARYGLRVTEDRSLELETDAQLHAWAGSLITSDGRPELRVDSVVPRPATDDLDSALRAWPAVCATDLGDRWTVRYRPAGGPPLQTTVGVLGVELELTPDDWSVRWLTATAPTPGTDDLTGGWFTLDVSDVDTGDLLAPFGGPPLPDLTNGV